MHFAEVVQIIIRCLTKTIVRKITLYLGDYTNNWGRVWRCK